MPAKVDLILGLRLPRQMLHPRHRVYITLAGSAGLGCDAAESSRIDYDALTVCGKVITGTTYTICKDKHSFKQNMGPTGLPPSSLAGATDANSPPAQNGEFTKEYRWILRLFRGDGRV